MFDSLKELAGGAFNIMSTHMTNRANAKQAGLNRDFQAYMSNTSHQREVEDLKAAGLNPILSANAGASTPGGAQATMQAPQIDPMMFTQAKAIKADTANKNADTSLKAEQENIAKETQKNLVEQNKILKSNAKQAESDAKKSGLEVKIMERYGNAQAITGIAGQAAGAFSNAIGAATGAKQLLGVGNKALELGKKVMGGKTHVIDKKTGEILNDNKRY